MPTASFCIVMPSFTEQLIRISTIPDWDKWEQEDASPPEPEVVERAILYLSELRNKNLPVPDDIGPTVENSIIFGWHAKNGLCALEIWHDDATDINMVIVTRLPDHSEREQDTIVRVAEFTHPEDFTSIIGYIKECVHKVGL